jgi:hypothetical protein
VRGLPGGRTLLHAVEVGVLGGPIIP